MIGQQLPVPQSTQSQDQDLVPSFVVTALWNFIDTQTPTPGLKVILHDFVGQFGKLELIWLT
jgi:hypothetical protein